VAVSKPPASGARGILVLNKALFRTNSGPVWSKCNEIRGEMASGPCDRILKQPLYYSIGFW